MRFTSLSTSLELMRFFIHKWWLWEVLLIWNFQWVHILFNEETVKLLTAAVSHLILISSLSQDINWHNVQTGFISESQRNLILQHHSSTVFQKNYALRYMLNMHAAYCELKPQVTVMWAVSKMSCKSIGHKWLHKRNFWIFSKFLLNHHFTYKSAAFLRI